MADDPFIQSAQKILNAGRLAAIIRQKAFQKVISEIRSISSKTPDLLTASQCLIPLVESLVAVRGAYLKEADTYDFYHAVTNKAASARRLLKLTPVLAEFSRARQNELQIARSLSILMSSKGMPRDWRNVLGSLIFESLAHGDGKRELGPSECSELIDIHTPAFWQVLVPAFAAAVNAEAVAAVLRGVPDTALRFANAMDALEKTLEQVCTEAPHDDGELGEEEELYDQNSPDGEDEDDEFGALEDAVQDVVLIHMLVRGAIPAFLDGTTNESHSYAAKQFLISLDLRCQQSDFPLVVAALREAARATREIRVLESHLRSVFEDAGVYDQGTGRAAHEIAIRVLDLVPSGDELTEIGVELLIADYCELCFTPPNNDGDEDETSY